MLSNFFKKISPYFSNVLFLWMVCLAINIITFVYIFFKIRPGKQTMALNYNVLIGVETFGKGINLYFIPAVGILILIINWLLFKFVKSNKNIFSPLAIFVSILTELVLLLSAILLRHVN
jgi:hypothetical protein